MYIYVLTWRDVYNILLNQEKHIANYYIQQDLISQKIISTSSYICVLYFQLYILNLPTFACTYICVYKYILHMHTFVYTYIHTCVNTYIFIYLNACICTEKTMEVYTLFNSGYPRDWDILKIIATFSYVHLRVIWLFIISM